MNIIHFKELSSTNAYCKENLQTLNEFDVVCTDYQSGGYGQWGRKWIDVGTDNIYMSIVLKPQRLREDIVRFTANCICEVLKRYGVVPEIKEPNDILVSGKKICGILAESVSYGEKIKGVVVGIGLNLNCEQKALESIDQPVTALSLEINRLIDKEKFIEEILNKIEKSY